MTVAIIGAGPSGLAMMRALQQVGIRADGYEAASGVGGLWDISNPRSTMYESAHLISSRTTTEFTEFPMISDVDYPGHQLMREYFEQYANHFDLTSRFQFDTRITRLQPAESGWELQATSAKTAAITRHYDHVVIANGTLATPNIPTFPGTFNGEIFHSAQYKSGAQFAGKRVLIIGAGNSGCDIAVDAVNHAISVDMSVRRGYYFVPRYILGRPSDTLNQGRPMPRPIKQFVDKWLLRMFTGNPVRFGFPEPNYKIYESHPIVNTMVLHHLGQGDLRVMAGIERLDGDTVHFADGRSADYDVILLATGYRLDYPFVDPEHLNWHRGETGESWAPELFLNIFTPNFNGLSVIGMVEASGLGWQGRFEQAELVASYIHAAQSDSARAARFRRRVATQPWPDLTAGYKYLGLERMSYYVNKDAYRAAVRREATQLRRPTSVTQRVGDVQ